MIDRSRQHRMLATHCVCCGRALVHAESIERGYGPECAKRVQGAVEGYPMASANPKLVATANALIYDAACYAQRGNIGMMQAISTALREMGFPVAADAIMSRFKGLKAIQKPRIKIRTSGGLLYVVAPFKRSAGPEFLAAWRAIPGRRFDGKCNIVPATRKRELWSLLCEFYPGVYGVADGKPFRVPSKA